MANIHDAVWYGNVGMAEQILRQDPGSINAVDENGKTPLHIAVIQGKEDVIQVLISHGADVNAKNNRGQTPLDLALGSDNTKVKALLGAPSTAAHQNDSSGVGFLGVLAWLLIFTGVGLIVYFALYFDTSVPVEAPLGLGVESGRVNNLGLMADRQIGVICGFGCTLIGIIMGAWEAFTRQHSRQ